MTLKTTASEIVISNRAGVEKFNSSNRLLYRKSEHTGSLRLGLAGGGWALAHRQFSPLISGDFYVPQLTIKNTNMNILSSMIGSTILLNFSLVAHFQPSTTLPVADHFIYICFGIVETETRNSVNGSNGSMVDFNFQMVNQGNKEGYPGSADFFDSLNFFADVDYRLTCFGF